MSRTVWHVLQLHSATLTKSLRAASRCKIGLAINSSRKGKGDTNALSSSNQDNPHFPRPATQLQKHTARLLTLHLSFLIRVGQLAIERLDTLGFGGPLGPFCGIGQAGDEV